MSKHKKNDGVNQNNLKEKAINFWNSDLQDLEPKLSLTKLDRKVLYQRGVLSGRVLLDRVYRSQ